MRQERLPHFPPTQEKRDGYHIETSESNKMATLDEKVKGRRRTGKSKRSLKALTKRLYDENVEFFP